MKCPFCENELTLHNEKKLFETLGQHVMCIEPTVKRAVWVCSNHTCKAHPAKKADVFWDEVGDFYGYIPRVDGELHSAIGSIARKIEIEVYKKDENTRMDWRGFAILKEYRYVADRDGNILSRKSTYAFVVHSYWSSGKSTVIGAIAYGLYSNVFHKGSAYWKTNKQRWEGIKENFTNMVKQLKYAFNKRNSDD